MKSLERSLQTKYLRLVLILSVLATLPHAWHLPPLVSLFFLLLVIWRFIGLSIPRLTPGRLFLGLLTLLGVLLVYSQHQTLMGRDAGVSLLTIMLTLKLMEIHRPRDIYVVCFMGYFIIVTQFLFSQSFLLTLYLLFTVVGITALLLELNRVKPSKRLLEPLRATLAISLQAIPIAAVLFILFPRISQPLWNFGNTGQGLTGLDDRVSPGSISQLIQSPAVAFRVSFFNDPPAPEDRYWRGLVIWDTDGFDWFNKSALAHSVTPPRLAQTLESISYQIHLEPHYKKWLFSLDLPASVPAGSRMTPDYLLIANQPVNQARKYQATSYTRYITQKPDQAALQRALKLPDNITQRQLDLVDRWKNQASDEWEIISLALQHFRLQPYVYTLAPPRYTDNPIDQFLFDGKEGFCEHYASSFTQLMRVAGIPTRMVIGYQGGEYNPLGDYFILRQSDAHAWTEVWLEQQGWRRIDPTAAVAPERVRHPIQLDYAGIGSPVLFRLEGGGLLTTVFDQLGLAMDAANLGWRRWIIGYNQDRQFRLLENFGFSFTQSWAWTGLLFSLIGFFLLLTISFILLKGRLREPAILLGYNRLCRKLARIGLPRNPSEGPLDYSHRVASLRPDLSAATQRIFNLYISARYAGQSCKKSERDFLRLVTSFRPRKPSR